MPCRSLPQLASPLNRLIHSLRKAHSFLPPFYGRTARARQPDAPPLVTCIGPYAPLNLANPARSSVRRAHA
ncbi:MAG: hypothetical protein ACTHJ8_06405 [Mucilaginibacter sp.]